MSEFCVINDAEDLLDRVSEFFPQPMTFEQAEWLYSMLDVLSTARSYAEDWQEDKASDDDNIVQLETELATERGEKEDVEGKLADMKDDYREADEERRTFELKCETLEDRLKTDWRFTDDPFKSWYKENIHDEARLEV